MLSLDIYCPGLCHSVTSEDGEVVGYGVGVYDGTGNLDVGNDWMQNP